MFYGFRSDSLLDGLALFVFFLECEAAHVNEVTVKGHWLTRLKEVCNRRVFRQNGYYG